MVQSVYWHLTTWQQGAPGLEVGARLSTAWEESSYWQSKRELRQLEETKSSLAKMISGLRVTLASPLGKLLDVKSVPEELRRGVELMQQGAAQELIDEWLSQLARTKLEWEWEKEQIFEAIRARDFANLPSRRRCMFLLDRETSPAAFAARYAFPANRLLLGIEPVEGESTLFRADMGALDLPSLPAEHVEARARNYWSGTPVEHEPMKTEILLEGTFVVRSIESVAARGDSVGPAS